MQIVFTEHATFQLTFRPEITVMMITDTIRDPDDLVRSYRRRRVYVRDFGNLTLWVVTVQEHDKIIVVTQYVKDT